MDIEYSVVIRTTGKAGEKYSKLLASVSRLIPQPKEVIVVLPEGYSLPKEQLGWERFCFCPKGMVIQRMAGIRECKTPFALICDDDIQFGPDFVEKLHEPIALGLCGFSAGPLYSFLPAAGKNAWISALTGSAAPMLFRKDRYVSVLPTTGYSYNRHLNSGKRRFYESQSLAWTCFYADVEALRSIEFEVEQLWLDKHGYAALDDQTMFYKAWLRGIKTIVVADAYYEHLDGRTSRDVPVPVLFSGAFNRVVFWHRYIFSQKETVVGKLFAILCFAYRLFWIWNWDIIKKTPAQTLKIKADGRKAGWEYLKSMEYRNLPPVK